MMLVGYFDRVIEAIEFIMAVGSLMGIFGLLYAAAWWNFVSKGTKQHLYRIIVASLILIGVCGLYTGIKYFRI